MLRWLAFRTLPSRDLPPLYRLATGPTDGAGDVDSSLSCRRCHHQRQAPARARLRRDDALILECREYDSRFTLARRAGWTSPIRCRSRLRYVQAAIERRSKLKEIERVREAIEERMENEYDHGLAAPRDDLRRAGTLSGRDCRPVLRLSYPLNTSGAGLNRSAIASP